MIAGLAFERIKGVKEAYIISFYEKDFFSVEAQAEELKKEALAIDWSKVKSIQESLPEQTVPAVVDGKPWKMFVGRGAGIDISANLKKTPVFARLLKNILKLSLRFLCAWSRINLSSSMKGL